VADDPSASWLRVAEVDALEATMNTDVATDHRHEITRHLATYQD
jgi:DNA topoisomerase VI subunit B